VSGTTRILDIQVPPGDISWYHTHTHPILYVTFSAGRLRIQNLGEDWGGGGGGRGAGRGGPGRGRPGRANGQPPAPSPFGRISSTTSYAEKPVTHRIQNVGDSLFRVVAVINGTSGDAGNHDSGAGFPGTPELTNAWFRAYRFSVAPGETTPSHTHTVPAVIIQASDGLALATGGITFDLNEQGRWAYFDPGVAHTVKNVGTTPVEFVEVEVRK
jgi:quercetin dioxygenase-like cupin family protein